MQGEARKRAAVRLGIVAVISSLGVCGAADAQQPYTTWREYGGGAHSSQYSALEQIDKSNVVAARGGVDVSRSDEQSFSFNPLIVDGVMYVAGHAATRSWRSTPRRAKRSGRIRTRARSARAA